VKEPAWLYEIEILAIQERLLSEHGGATGLREVGLLRSALDRPLNLHVYGKPSLFELAAAYAFGIAKNHPFLDGNKRSALLAAAVFIEKNGYELNAPEAEAVLQTLGLAAGEVSEKEYSLWLKKNSVLLRKQSRKRAVK
jgi:death-on-curing protein